MHALRLAPLFALATTALACGSWEAPAPPPCAAIPAYPGGPERAASAEKPAKSSFASLADRLLDQWLADDPSLGRSLGLHQYDGKVAKFSRAAIEARVARLKQALTDLGAVDKAALTPDERLDHALLTSRAELSLFQLTELSEWRLRPQFYAELFTVNDYLDRDYAPIAERAERLLAHEEAALAEVPHIRENLASPMPRAVLETSIKNYKGFVEYLRSDVPKQLAGVGSAAFQEKLGKTNEALAKAAEGLADHLAKVELKKGDESHVLGPERFKKLLKVQEGLDVSLADFRKMGEEDLARNKKAYEELAKKRVAQGRVEQDKLFDEAARLVDVSRRFIVEKALVTIPTEEKALVKETPPFMRWNAAFLDAPGAFEDKAQTAFYYITKPDPSWTKKEQVEYLPLRGVALSTAIHEVYPGHFLQRQWERRAPTRTQKILESYSFVEGWAHYGEQMMIEEGFGADDAQNRMGQLSDALLRNCRVVVSLGVHTEGMKLAAAEKRFVQDCHQDKASARQEAARATFDPGYFAYTLGKIQILALREEAKKRLGNKFSLKRFHDALLAHGAPPVPLIRERVLADLAAGP
jgi:uncharacterized protein (DUF885 family)